MTEFDEGAERELGANRVWMSERPLASELGFECQSMSPGRSVWTLDSPERWLNPNGSVSGAMIAALADHAVGSAAFSVTGQDAYTVTVDLSTRFLRAAFKRPLTCEATVDRRGRRLAFVHFDIRDSDGDKVADGTATFFIESRLGRAHPVGEPSE